MFKKFESWRRTSASNPRLFNEADTRQASIIVIGLLMIGLGWLGVFYHLSSRRIIILKQAQSDVLNLSVAMEKNIERLLVGADQVMNFIADDLTHNSETFDFQAWMRRSTSLIEIANQISFYNETGELLGSRTPLAPGMPQFNVRDRDYFKALAANPNLGLYIDRTMRGRITGRYVLQTARRYNRPDGSFGGVIVTSINPDYLAQQFASLDVGRRGSVAMFGHDGFIRARFPQTEGMYERNIRTMRAGKDVFAYLKESPAGTYEVESGIDHISRIFGYRAVGTYPLIVTVGKSLDEVLAPYKVERTHAITAAIVATVLFLGVLLILLRMLRRDREQQLRLAATNLTLSDQKEAAHAAAEEARHANRLLTLAAQMAHVGHWRLDPRSNFVTWSDEVFGIFGLDPAAGVPSLRAAVDAYHPDDRDKVACFVSDAIREGSDYEFTARALRPDGSIREVLCRGCCEIEPGGDVTALFGMILDVTEMRASERAVRESEALFRSFADNSAAVLWIVNAQSQSLEYLSPAFEAVWGESRDTVLTDIEQWIELIHPDDRGRILEAMPRSLAGEAVTLEYRIVRPNDGELRWIRDSGFPIPAPDGRVLRVAGMAFDITEEVHAKRALAESEARYRLLAENTRDMIVQVDFDTTRRYVSPASRRLLGYEPEELVGTKSLDMVHIDDQPVVRAVMTDLASGARGSAVQRKRYRRKDGRYVWVEVGYQVFHDEAERPVGCIACARDITDNIEAEHRLTENEQRFRLLAENTRDMIFQVDLDRVWRYASPACRELLGYAPEELVGTKPFHIVHPDDRERVRCETMGLVEGRREVIRSRRRYEHKEGYYVETEVSYRILKDEQGRPLGYVACARDVTDQVVQEMALEEARLSAEQARAEAERASQAKTEFLAAMSHELRTPLNAIIGFTDILVGSGRLEPGSQRQAELVRTSGVALLTIVNDILDFSKVEAGAIELAAETFDLRALIDNCVSMVRGIAASKRLQVKTLIDDKLPVSLLGDEVRLRQVLLNLLNNAIKFTPAGSVTLMIRHDGTAPEGERLHFSVTDTGIGILKAKQERLFQRFSQADETVHRTYGGTGLGLAICKQLVELMGGEIGLHSEEHQGSTFWFNLTLPSATLQSVLEPVTEAPKPQRKGRLLLAEDVAINQELARTVLEAAGHTVEIVGDGAAAVQAVQVKSFDLVLMDIQMPGMDGVTATRLIRRLPNPIGRIPVIAMTANVLPDELRRFREAGVNDHIGKPFNRVELYATVDRWLSADVDAEARDATPDKFGFDRSIYEGVAHILPPQRLSDALTTLLEDLEGSFADPVRRREDRARLRFEAHSLTSAAGTIGFIDLSAACRALEACTEEHINQTGPDVFGTVLEAVRSQTKIATKLLKQLIEEVREADVDPEASTHRFQIVQ